MTLSIQTQNHINLTAIRSIPASDLREGMWWRDDNLQLKIQSVKHYKGGITIGFTRASGGGSVVFDRSESVKVSWEVAP